MAHSPDEMAERLRVVAIARTWLLCPYHHAAMIKGVGVDCATLIAGVFEEAGLIEHVEVPKYGPQWHLHRHVERYRDEVLKRARLVKIEDVKPADVVLYHWGHVKAHGGIVTERGWPFIIHAYSRAGFVVEADGTGGDLADKGTEFFSYW